MLHSSACIHLPGVSIRDLWDTWKEAVPEPVRIFNKWLQPSDKILYDLHKDRAIKCEQQPQTFTFILVSGWGQVQGSYSHQGIEGSFVVAAVCAFGKLLGQQLEEGDDASEHLTCDFVMWCVLKLDLCVTDLIGCSIVFQGDTCLSHKSDKHTFICLLQDRLANSAATLLCLYRKEIIAFRLKQHFDLPLIFIKKVIQFYHFSQS